jgi:hypothetical protein
MFRRRLVWIPVLREPDCGIPEECEVFGPDGESLAKGSSDDTTDYFGLGISESGNCKVQFELADGLECGPNSIGFETHVVDS